jgi:hypothetical protein
MRDDTIVSLVVRTFKPQNVNVHLQGPKGIQVPSIPTQTNDVLSQSREPSSSAFPLPTVAAAGAAQTAVPGDKAVGARAHAQLPMSRK